MRGWSSAHPPEGNPMSNNFLFTSESVTEGHPDKVADQISDAVVDAIMEKDPEGRVACETMVTTGVAFLGGDFLVRCLICDALIQSRVLFHLLLNHFRKFKPGKLQQFYGLLELGGHDQLLCQGKALL